MQECMSNINRDESFNKDSKGNDRKENNNNTETEMKNIFNNLISSLDTDKKIISKTEFIYVETLQT